MIFGTCMFLGCAKMLLKAAIRLILSFACCRYCFFPQEIVLELQQPSRIINMQLLCHEFKVTNFSLNDVASASDF